MAAFHLGLHMHKSHIPAWWYWSGSDELQQVVEGSAYVSAGIWTEGAVASKDYRYTQRGQGSLQQNRGVS